MEHRLIPALAAICLALACLAGAAAVAEPAAAAALPPELVARLEADRARAEATLRAQRTALGRAAARHRSASAARERTRVRTEAIEDVLEVIPFEIPASFTAGLRRSRAASERAARSAEVQLAARTQDAASAQAFALDADRRMRALQRASATEDDVDATLGSWRFGSGGPSVSAATLDAYLASKGSPLAGEGAAFLRSGVEHKVDPRLIVAIAGAESYFGITLCAPHNAWGWGCPNAPFRFADWAEGIDTVTRGLRTGYLDDGLHSIGEIHLRYAPPDAENDPTDLNYGWSDNVARFLVEQGGDPQDVEGVLGPSN